MTCMLKDNKPGEPLLWWVLPFLAALPADVGVHVLCRVHTVVGMVVPVRPSAPSMLSRAFQSASASIPWLTCTEYHTSTWETSWKQLGNLTGCTTYDNHTM